jgi:hypothetical protein
MSKSQGLSAGELHHAGAFTGVAAGDKAPEVRSSEGTSSLEAPEAHSMLPVGKEGAPNIGGPGMDSALKLGGSMAELFNYFTKAGGALGSSISECFGKMATFLGTDELKGDNLAIKDLGPGEITSHGIASVRGDLQIKDFSATSQQGGAEH